MRKNIPVPEYHYTAFSESEFNGLISTLTNGNYAVGEPVASRPYGVIYEKDKTVANIYNRATPEGGRGRWCYQVELSK